VVAVNRSDLKNRLGVQKNA